MSKIGYFERHKLTLKESLRSDSMNKEKKYYIELEFDGKLFALVKEHTFKTEGEAHIFIEENNLRKLCMSAEVITEQKKEYHYG